jgi:glutathione synthase/RimK-type ligase-like ATP-grasp enzyme
LNTEDLPGARSCWQLVDAHSTWTIAGKGRTLDLNTVTAAYLRRPLPPDLLEIADIGERRHAMGEWVALLEALYGYLDNRWLNAPAAMALAEDKLRQLTLAARLGFNVPVTMVSNDADAVASVADDGTIAKPLRSGMVTGASGQSVIFSSRLTDGILAENRASVSLAPFIIQREIIKACDIRVTVVGRQVFSAAIHSQDTVASQTDWRRGDVIAMPHTIHSLPAEMEERVRALVAGLGLRFGAIDLVLDRQGAYWFLEINPNGQWAWVETMTGLPIAATIVDELESIARA